MTDKEDVVQQSLEPERFPLYYISITALESS
jgi:hypothetical protein